MTEKESHANYPAFDDALASLSAARVRDEIEVGPIRPPQRLAPLSHAVGLEVTHTDKLYVPEQSEGDAFGRFILLCDPEGTEVWDGTMRIVTYIQADMDPALATDPMVTEVAWSWLADGLKDRDVDFKMLGGTVTSTNSVRYGDLSGPPSAYQIELRASWTALDNNLAPHLEAVADTLASVSGLPPEGVTSLTNRKV